MIEQSNTFSHDDRVLRWPEVKKIVGLSRVTAWRLERDGRFPRRLQLGGNSCGWLLSEVRGWLEQRAAAR